MLDQSIYAIGRDTVCWRELFVVFTVIRLKWQEQACFKRLVESQQQIEEMNEQISVNSFSDDPFGGSASASRRTKVWIYGALDGAGFAHAFVA